MLRESHATLIQLAARPGWEWKCLSGMKTRTEKTAKGTALTAMKNRRRPRRARDRSDQEAMRGLVTASNTLAPKVITPMIVNTPRTAPWKRKGGKTAAEPSSGGM